MCVLLIWFILSAGFAHGLLHFMFKHIKSSPEDFPGRLYFAAALGVGWFVALVFNVLQTLLVQGMLISVNI